MTDHAPKIEPINVSLLFQAAADRATETCDTLPLPGQIEEFMLPDSDEDAASASEDTLERIRTNVQADIDQRQAAIDIYEQAFQPYLVALKANTPEAFDGRVIQTQEKTFLWEYKPDDKRAHVMSVRIDHAHPAAPDTCHDTYLVVDFWRPDHIFVCEYDTTEGFTHKRVGGQRYGSVPKAVERIGQWLGEAAPEMTADFKALARSMTPSGTTPT